MTDRVRRNGQPSSCEPCRRSKLRCDHARPHCTRCVRRNFTRQCFYHPSPMTRSADSYTEALLTPQSARQIDTATTPSVCASFMPAENPSVADYDRGTGLVTMHNPLMPFADSNGSHPHRTFAYLTRTSVFTPKRTYPVTPAAISEGVEVLRSLLEFNADFSEIIRDQDENDIGEPCGSLFFKAAWKATQSTLQELGTRPPLDQLTSTAIAIFEQTACPLELPISAENGALELALSGHRLRWETIGMCFIRIGLFSATVRTNGQVFYGRGPSNFDRQRTMLIAFNACMQTLAFCDQVEQTNDLTLWLLTSLLIHATWCFGDDSSRAWRLMGDLASAIAALGFHKGFKRGESGPPYLVELRKRVIALAHERDKELATFVGRPPRLSRRYYVVDLPLDLPDAIIAGPVEHFEAARAELDENGWSGDVMVNPVSRLRAILLLSMIREEVLELSLGPPMPNIAQQARQILSKLNSTWESIPHKQYEQSMFDTMLPSAIWVVIGPRLEYLYSKFLLHKLLISQNEGNRDKMIWTSHEILHLALSLLKKNDVIATPNLEGTMVFYAMPCASVLILELFRQNRQPHRSATLNRSTLIQDISVLISCCDSLAISGQSNYQICKQAQIVFSRCLDQILNQTATSSHDLTSEPGGTEVQEPFSLGSMDFGLTELYRQDPEWSMWLESFDLYET
ncbi:hypothetical protein BGW36DRAFT_101904 [Talaromyces proteolyticus]|uniref:Zn(2)-C6 fungal-type domain-containing protein n=1 Tax=Talaromyces proteolyticus TaxID=1131652 RepID=A0AAD4L037_9EURO|nr:uncharacterized protein BGW36DRAFT_101904 [Talaromyces proteolyticus]KAH8701636.1 hypothetical protein BGW36DRAFT_101904 [Talaromyces proteolyticus]